QQDRVAGKKTDETESDNGDPKEGGDQHDQLSGKVSEHGLAVLSGRGPWQNPLGPCGRGDLAREGEAKATPSGLAYCAAVMTISIRRRGSPRSLIPMVARA